MTKLREEWLNEGLLLLGKQVFLPHRYKLSPHIQVSCGFPSSGAFGVGKRTIGQCWYPNSTGGNHQLFISPTIADPVKVLDVLVHEVVHTVVGSEAKHGKQFKYAATRVGLVGKMTSTVAGPKLEAQLKAMAKRLGEYPHKPIVGLLKPKRVMPKWIRCECDCEYVIRMPEEQLEQGIPDCPVCGTPLNPAD